MEREPAFFSTGGSVQSPGVFETIFFGRSVSAYEVFKVPHGKVFVLTHVSASVTRGGTPYPAENLNDYGAVGYKKAEENHFHFLPFVRSEPGGILVTSQAIEIYVPANAQVIVKVPLVTNQSGGSSINVSGYYLKS